MRMGKLPSCYPSGLGIGRIVNHLSAVCALASLYSQMTWRHTLSIKSGNFRLEIEIQYPERFCLCWLWALLNSPKDHYFPILHWMSLFFAVEYDPIYDLLYVTCKLSNQLLAPMNWAWTKHSWNARPGTQDKRTVCFYSTRLGKVIPFEELLCASRGSVC